MPRSKPSCVEKPSSLSNKNSVQSTRQPRSSSRKDQLQEVTPKTPTRRPAQSRSRLVPFRDPGAPSQPTTLDFVEFVAHTNPWKPRDYAREWEGESAEAEGIRERDSADRSRQGGKCVRLAVAMRRNRGKNVVLHESALAGGPSLSMIDDPPQRRESSRDLQ